MWRSEGSHKMQALWLLSALWLMPSGGLARSSINGILMSLSLLMRWTPGALIVQANTVGMTGSSSQSQTVNVFTEMSIPRWKCEVNYAWGIVKMRFYTGWGFLFL